MMTFSASTDTLFPHADALYAPTDEIVSRPECMLASYRFQPVKPLRLSPDSISADVRYASFVDALRQLGGKAYVFAVCDKVGVSDTSGDARKAIKALIEDEIVTRSFVYDKTAGRKRAALTLSVR